MKIFMASDIFNPRRENTFSAFFALRESTLALINVVSSFIDINMLKSAQRCQEHYRRFTIFLKSFSLNDFIPYRSYIARVFGLLSIPKKSAPFLPCFGKIYRNNRSSLISGGVAKISAKYASCGCQFVWLKILSSVCSLYRVGRAVIRIAYLSRRKSTSHLRYVSCSICLENGVMRGSPHFGEFPTSV